MWPLIQAVIDIALGRKGPQVLPASRFLLGLFLIAYAVVSFFEVMLFGVGALETLALVLIDIAMWVGWLWLVLRFFGKLPRFVQTTCAVLGVSILFSLLDGAVRVLFMVGGAPVPAAWELFGLLLFAMLVGRVIALAIDSTLLTGFPLTIAIVLSTAAVSQFFFHK